VHDAGPDVFAGRVGAPVKDWKLYDTHYTERYMGTPQSNPDRLHKEQRHALRGRPEGSCLIMHGMADATYWFTHSTTLFKKLQDLNEPFEVMTYPAVTTACYACDMGRHGYMTINGSSIGQSASEAAGDEEHR